MRVVKVVVDVAASTDGSVVITCTPDAADVLKDTKHALINFFLNTTGYRFPLTDAITLDPKAANAEDAAKNFPFQSWTISDTQAALYDNNKSADAFAYTVSVINNITGKLESVDPVINNGGGGSGMDDC
jgi:hypothetical protein